MQNRSIALLFVTLFMLLGISGCTTINDTKVIVSSDIYEVTLAEIVRSQVGNNNAFANYKAEEKFISIKGIYYSSDFKTIKIYTSKHGSKAIETLVVAKSDGKTIVYISDNGQISKNEGYTYNTNSANAIDVEFADLTPVTLIRLRQGNNPYYNLDLQANVVSSYSDSKEAKWISGVVGSHLSPASVIFSTITSSSYFKFVYNSSVVIEVPAGYDEVKLFPWTNNSFIFEVSGTGKETKYYSTNGTEISCTITKTNRNCILKSGDSTETQITLYNIVEDSGMHRIIFVFPKEIIVEDTVTFTDEETGKEITTEIKSYHSYSCFSYSSDMGNIDITNAVTDKDDSTKNKNAIVTFSNVKNKNEDGTDGALKQFDLLSGAEI